MAEREPLEVTPPTGDYREINPLDSTPAFSSVGS